MDNIKAVIAKVVHESLNPDGDFGSRIQEELPGAIVESSEITPTQTMIRVAAPSGHISMPRYFLVKLTEQL